MPSSLSYWSGTMRLKMYKSSSSTWEDFSSFSIFLPHTSSDWRYLAVAFHLSFPHGNLQMAAGIFLQFSIPQKNWKSLAPNARPRRFDGIAGTLPRNIIRSETQQRHVLRQWWNDDSPCYLSTSVRWRTNYWDWPEGWPILWDREWTSSKDERAEGLSKIDIKERRNTREQELEAKATEKRESVEQKTRDYQQTSGNASTDWKHLLQKPREHHNHERQHKLHLHLLDGRPLFCVEIQNGWLRWCWCCMEVEWGREKLC